MSPERLREILHYFQDLYAGNTTQEVLIRFFQVIQKEYPSCRFRYWLSHGNLSGALGPEPIDVTARENRWIYESFASGQVVRHGESGEVAVPIVGQQGVYGVVTVQSSAVFDEEELERFRLYSGACGSAFEKAHLFEQANQLIEELNLLNDVTKKLTRHLKREEILSLICSEVQRIFQTDACIAFDLEGEVLSSSPQESREVMNHHTEVVKKLISQMVESGDGLIFAHVGEELKDAQDFPYGSLVAMPLGIENEVMLAFFAVSFKPSHFTFQQFRLLRSLMDVTSLSMNTALLHHQVHQMAVTDYLTKLYARSYLDEQVKNSLREDPYGSFVLIDIDSFKKIDDTFGHQVGDQILIQVAQIMKENVRQRTDIAARWGGEELVLYLPNVKQELAFTIAERIRFQVEAKTSPPVTISCGISSWSREAPTSLDQLFRLADHALYQAKHTGKNCVHVADSS